MRQKIDNKRILFLALLLAAAAVCFTACLFSSGGESQIIEEEGELHEIIEAEEEPVKKEPVSLSISCVGDVMVHLSQIYAQHDKSTDTYDFENNFKYVKKYIKAADLALCNLETTFGGKPYDGYPMFSAPDELAPALKSAGFDVAVFANNHILDRGAAGLFRTVDILKENSLLTAGVRASEEEARYTMLDVKDVKIAVAAYTYASSNSSGRLLINGSAAPQGVENLINYIRYSHIDEDIAKIKETADEARAAGADIVIIYYHWGEEYQLKSNEYQRKIAEKTVSEVGADIIFASHPHTLQEAVFITNEETEKRVPVFYSMGNFISNQRKETLNNHYTEIGIIAQVGLVFDVEERKITSISMSAIPTWVEKYRTGGRDIYAVIPLDDDLEQNETLAASGHLARAKKALEEANGILKIDR